MGIADNTAQRFRNECRGTFKILMKNIYTFGPKKIIIHKCAHKMYILKI